MQARRLVMALLALGLLLPFVLMQDLFPFYRFGMFAEPVRNAIQTERFVLLFTVSDARPRVFDPASVDMGEDNFRYLARNFYYRGEVANFVQNIDQLYHQPQVRKWLLLRIVDNKDSTLVFSWQKP